MPNSPRSAGGKQTIRNGLLNRTIGTVIATLAATVAITPHTANANIPQAPPYPHHLLKRIHAQRNIAWHYESLIGRNRTPYHYYAERVCNYAPCKYRILVSWHKVAKHWHYLYQHIGTAVYIQPLPANVKAGFLCIHSYEGAWNANTGNGYYGGLQMDYSFMQSYGNAYLRHYGTADKWSPEQQLAAAYKAYKVRGYSPWPTTSKLCGL